MKRKTKNILLITSALVVICLAVVAINQFILLRKAHSTFENYYAFRGCTQLVKKTDNYSLCKLSTGQTIKIVEFRGKWYLDGDLPICIGNICM